MGHVWTWLESKGKFFTESEKSSSCQSFCSSPDSSLDFELKWGSWREMEGTDEEDLGESSSQEENGRSEIDDPAACEKVSTKNQEEAETYKKEVDLQYISEEEVVVENIEEQVEDSDFHMSYGNNDASRCGTPQMSSPSTSTSSLPSMQLSQEDLLQQRLVFRRTLLSIWKMVTGHRFSGPFLKAVSERQAPGYNEVVKRPMDLSSIKRSLSKGQIQNMIELQRDLMLMFQNAIMYNSSNHHIHRIAVEMQREVLEQLQMLGEVLLCSEEMQGFLRGAEDSDY